MLQSHKIKLDVVKYNIFYYLLKASHLIAIVLCIFSVLSAKYKLEISVVFTLYPFFIFFISLIILNFLIKKHEVIGFVLLEDHSISIVFNNKFSKEYNLNSDLQIKLKLGLVAGFQEGVVSISTGHLYHDGTGNYLEISNEEGVSKIQVLLKKKSTKKALLAFFNELPNLNKTIQVKVIKKWYSSFNI